ncbi:MAG: hypothetical protein ACUVUC_12785 [Thermoguttaceae bacterium]
MWRRCIIAVSVLAVLAWAGGCTRSGRPRTVKVVGTVTHKGKPVEGAMVTFIPPEGRPASGITDVSGKFELSTFRSGDGALPGKHVVTITESYKDKAPAMPMPGMPLESRFPPKYGDPKTTPFSADVEPGRMKELHFDIPD